MGIYRARLVIKNELVRMAIWRRGGLFAGETFDEGVEIFEAGVFDDDSAAAVFVFNVNLEAEGALEELLGFADVRVDFWFGLGLLFGFFRVDEVLYVGLSLANRKRK